MTWNHQAEFDEVYERHIRAIYAYCLRRTTFADAPDATAEVFTVVWRRWADRPVDEELVPWIYGIARNVVANRNRSVRRHLRLTAKLTRLRPGLSVDPESSSVVDAEHQEVREALAKLSATHQETLQLIEWEGLSRDQVAAIFGVTRAAIDQRISRAYRQLGTLLGADPTPTRTGADFAKEDL